MTINRQPCARGPRRTDGGSPFKVRMTRYNDTCRTGPQQEEFEKMRDKKGWRVSKAVRA
jgi:hypothetical protein